MSDLSDADKSRISAETARKNLASKIPIEEIIARVDKYDGAGLTPSEVLALREYIEELRDLADDLWNIPEMYNKEEAEEIHQRYKKLIPN